MGKNQKNERHPVMKSKYFKWGLTAFVVIMASVLSIYLILNITSIGKSISGLIRMIMPIVDGLIVAYVLSPLIDLFEDKLFIPYLKKHNIEITDKKRSQMRTVSIFLSLLIVFFLIYLFVRSVIPQVIESIQNIISQMPIYMESLINIANTVITKFDLFPERDIMAVIEHYYEDIMGFVQENIVPSINGWVKTVYSSVFSFLGALWDLLIGFFIAVYLLSSKERFRAQVKKLIYSLFARERANLIVEDIRYIDKTFISFVAGKIIDSIIIGMLCFIVLTIINMPYTLLISVIIGITNIIPFFGPFIGAIPSAILILLIDPVKALYFVIFIIILQQIDGNLIGPLILGNSTGLSGFWVIFSITLFGGLWGMPGFFLGVPTFACLYAWLRRFMRESLAEKELPSDTDNYLNLEYIDKNNRIHEKKSKRTINLNANDKKSSKKAKDDDVIEVPEQKESRIRSLFGAAYKGIGNCVNKFKSKKANDPDDRKIESKINEKEWTLRTAKSSDESAIRSLFIEMLKTIYNTDDVNGYEDGYLDRFFDNKNQDWICVAQSGEKVVAYLSIEVHHEEQDYIYLDDLSVTKDYRNLGIGSALIKNAEIYAKENDIEVIVFHVEKSNADAYRLYERLGYNPDKEEGSRLRMIKFIK
ncbi:MAG: AI-2E family transporter [Lachnospiraceae bacterium]|nr:AI-2E family transporter [Lachnospiraceae bacterium]